jgi:hypothetical protein
MAGLAMARPDAAIADAKPVGFFDAVGLRHLLFFFSPFELIKDTESESLPPVGVSRLGLIVSWVCVREIGSKVGLCGGLAVKVRMASGDSEMGDIPDNIKSSPPEDGVVGVIVSKLDPPDGVVAALPCVIGIGPGIVWLRLDLSDA